MGASGTHTMGCRMYPYRVVLARGLDTDGVDTGYSHYGLVLGWVHPVVVVVASSGVQWILDT